MTSEVSVAGLCRSSQGWYNGKASWCAGTTEFRTLHETNRNMWWNERNDAFPEPEFQSLSSLGYLTSTESSLFLISWPLQHNRLR